MTNENSALFTDFYELTMAQGYWKRNKNQQAVFELFFRRHPFNGGFSVFAGIETAVDQILDFSFTDSDLEFLKSQGLFEDDFLSYLKDFKFTGDIYAFSEGSLIFPQEPLVRIHGNIVEAQIIESVLLNHCNFQSLIATKSARIWLSSEKKDILEFGMRRSQGPDGALSASRAAFIGGAKGTSNTLAGKIFDIPVFGTMAHSWVMSFESEKEAFEAYAQMYPDSTVFLIDTYDSLKSGIKNAIEVGKKLKDAGHNFGIRLDSGDMSYLSSQVRKELDKSGLNDAFITVSNELTEEIISNLVAQKAPIDSYGVGTNLVTGGSESSFSGVYKLCQRYDEDGKSHPVMKFCDNPAKTTNPGIKNVYRLYDENGLAGGDVLTLEGEEILENREYLYHHPMIDYRRFSFSASKVESLLTKVVENGKRLWPRIPDPQQIRIGRQRMMNQLESFDDSYKRILNPHIYKVSISEGLKDLKLDFINKNQG